ncbi:MAG: TerB family tellurite resistance protein [Cyanobacteria bacterium J06632_19]
MSDEMISVSSFAKDEYGISAAPIEAMINYGYVLLAIAGADEEVSEKEMDWLIIHQMKFGAPQDVIELYKYFDYKNANIEELLPNIKVDVATWSASRELIYNAIRMSSADGIYAQAERETVKKAAKMLGVSDDIVLTLENLVNTIS